MPICIVDDDVLVVGALMRTLHDRGHAVAAGAAFPYRGRTARWSTKIIHIDPHMDAIGPRARPKRAERQASLRLRGGSARSAPHRGNVIGTAVGSCCGDLLAGAACRLLAAHRRALIIAIPRALHTACSRHHGARLFGGGALRRGSGGCFSARGRTCWGRLRLRRSGCHSRSNDARGDQGG